MRDITAEKRRVAVLLERLADGAPAREVFASDAVAQVSHPWGICTGPDEIGAVYSAIKTALPDHERRADILIGGENLPDARAGFDRVSPLVGWLGHLQGHFRAPLLGIPATDHIIYLRLAEVHHLNADGMIARSWIMPDLLDLMYQAEVWPLPRMFGVPTMWPGPRGGAGVRLDGTDAVQGASSMARVLEMHAAFNGHPGNDVSSLTMAQWAPNFMYYAAAGIGTMRGVDGFRKHHQVPFRTGFPVKESRGHFVRIGDGPFALTGGRLYAEHSGEYLGAAPTGRQLHLDVMDFYRIDETGLIAENWLPFDILGLMQQMGVDLLARVAHYAGR
jgi:predicted ester cyclase